MLILGRNEDGQFRPYGIIHPSSKLRGLSQHLAPVSPIALGHTRPSQTPVTTPAPGSPLSPGSAELSQAAGMDARLAAGPSPVPGPAALYLRRDRQLDDRGPYETEEEES